MQRKTRQREAIWKVIEAEGHPLSPLEIMEMARAEVPNLGMATVYRTINGLVEEGELIAVAIPGQPNRYEKAGLQHHHHFHCEDCDRVFEIERCPAHIDELAPKGFTVRNHEIMLTGSCPDCGS